MTQEQVERFLANEQLVHWTIFRYFGERIPPEEREDYISAGRIGLAHACKIFDPTKGFTFSTLAVKCIYSEVHKALKNQTAKKRTPPPDTMSLDSVVINRNNPGNPTILSEMIESPYDLERHVEAREQLRLASEDPVFKMMVEEGYTLREASDIKKVSVFSVRNQKRAVWQAIQQLNHPPKFRRKEVKRYGANV